MALVPLTKIVGWVRQGYPAGIPTGEYVALIAVLRRRLGDDEVQEVADVLVHEGIAPADRIDIGVEITKVTDTLPTPDEIVRVRTHLEAHGWPVETDDPEWVDGYPT